MNEFAILINLMLFAFNGFLYIGISHKAAELEKKHEALRETLALYRRNRFKRIK